MKRKKFLELTTAGFVTSYLIDSRTSFAENKILDQSKFIWFDHKTKKRNLYGLFRKSFQISQKVKSAKFNLFADTAYQLFINGKFLEFGPVRFDPKFPLYDSHEISQDLQPGNNIIAIRVNYFGHKTFKSIQTQAGWIGWGNIELENGQIISLDTKKGNWRSHSDEAYWRYASKISFALNAAELFDQSREEMNWKEINFNDNHWSEVVELGEPLPWGKLKPRSIPYMSGKTIALEKVVYTLPLLKQEDWYSFSVPIPHFFEDNQEEFSKFLVFSTWIYSVKKQEVTVGVFWGDHWLNGNKIAKGILSEQNMRLNQIWELEKGWNYLFGKVEVYYDVLHQYFAFPQGKGIIVSAEKNPDSLYTFKHSPILKKAEFERYLKNKSLPYSPEETLSEIEGWIYVTKDEIAQSPCRETSWDSYGEAMEKISLETLEGHVFSLNNYPNGFSVLMDLGYTHLVFPHIELEGVKGAIIDLTYSERLNSDNLYLFHQHIYSDGDRLLCSRNQIKWFPHHPRGVRYVKLTVRQTNADVTLKSFFLRSGNYPVETKGWFRCSDPIFNEIWLMGQRTLAINMEDAFVDTPGRERGMYIRDTIIQYHVNLATFGDQALMQRCLELFGQSPDDTGKFRAVYPNTGNYTITDFALNLVEGYKAYYENTGDSDQIKTDWAAIINNLQWFHNLADQRQDLLLNADWHIDQNISGYRAGFFGDQKIVDNYLDRTGINCLFSCTYLIALQSAVFLARVIGKNQDAVALQKRIDILFQTIPQTFWNSKKGCFSDNLSRRTHSLHSNLFAVRAGIVNNDQMKSIKKYVTNELCSLFVNGLEPSGGYLVSPSFAFYILDGLYQCGLKEVAENMMRQGWGWVLNQGLKTCPEYFTLEQSHSHAWSASPTYYLSKYMLGIVFPKAPNLNVVEIRVQSHDITYAEGAFPHPKGLIEVKWHLEEGKRIFDHIKAPSGVEIIINPVE